MIIKDKIHPLNSPTDDLYPETSIDQVVNLQNTLTQFSEYHVQLQNKITQEVNRIDGEITSTNADVIDNHNNLISEFSINDNHDILTLVKNNGQELNLNINAIINISSPSVEDGGTLSSAEVALIKEFTTTCIIKRNNNIFRLSQYENNNYYFISHIRNTHDYYCITVNSSSNRYTMEKITPYIPPKITYYNHMIDIVDNHNNTMYVSFNFIDTNPELITIDNILNRIGDNYKLLVQGIYVDPNNINVHYHINQLLLSSIACAVYCFQDNPLSSLKPFITSLPNCTLTDYVKEIK